MRIIRNPSICRGCGMQWGETPREFGPWALLDVATPSGVCRECAAAMRWSPPLLADIGTLQEDEAIAAHNAKAAQAME